MQKTDSEEYLQNQALRQRVLVSPPLLFISSTTHPQE